MKQQETPRVSKDLQKYLPSDALLARIQPFLPVRVNTHRFGGGKPRAADRKCMNGIFFVLRTGGQWNALNATGICPSSTAHERFQEWVAAGVFQKLWAASLLDFERLKGLDWSWLSMDGALSKAPLGGEKKRAQPHRPGQARRQTEPADRRPRRSHWAGSGRGQPPRHEVDPAHP